MAEYLCIISNKKPDPLPEGFSELSGADYRIGIRGRYKFEKDCILEEDQDTLVLLIGVVFNKLKLISGNKKETWFQTVSDLYRKNGDTFFKVLKGSFNGIIYDKLKDKWLAFSNIQSERPVFYSIIDQETIIASNISLIHELHLQKGRRLTLDTDGAYMMLSYGFMLGEYSLYNEIRRMKAGFYLVYEKERSIRQTEYYRFSNAEDTSLGENEIIETADSLFLEAVRLQFEKDREYGFRHITSLSGGLDSRMTVFCSHELGYTDQLNLTYSQSGYLEQTIAGEIASRLRHEWLFKSLDNGLFLTDLDTSTLITGGNILYYAIAMEYGVFSILNMKEFGLLHTGQIGGLFYFYPKHRKPTVYDGAHSTKLIDRVSRGCIKNDDFENEEIFLIHNRYLNGTNYGLAGILEFTETFSPHYDIELWEYCLKVPLKYRYKHKIYKEWIIRKHPVAAEFIWEKTGIKIQNNLRDRFRFFHHGKPVTIKEAASGLYRRIARRYGLKYRPSLQGMNPFDSWMIINTDLNDFYSGYFKDNISLVNDNSELRSDISSLFTTGNAWEKIQVLTLLSAVKNFIKA